MNITFKDVEYTKPYNWFEVWDNKDTLPQNEYSKYVKYVETRYTDRFYYYYTDSIIGQSLRHYGEYTQTEINLLNNFINKDCVVYDIGANIGYHTLGLAQNSKHVYAFEPNNKNYFLLQQNTRKIKNITNYNIALGNEHKVATISDFNLDTVGNYGECMMLDDGNDNGQHIDCVRLDDYILQHDIPHPHLVKIDVEGYEYEVLTGMKNIIESSLPVIFYEHLHGDHLPDIYDYLTGFGYTIYWYPVSNYNPNNFKKNTNNIFGYGGVVNALAMPKTILLKTNMIQKTHRDQSWNDVVMELQKNNAQ